MRASRTKAAKALTPGEKREKAKEEARKEVKELTDKAARMRAELEEVRKKVVEPNPGKTGRIMEPERVAKMQKALRDIADQNILFQPNQGPQTEFLAAPETDVLYGGAAGGGKSFAMIVDPLRYAHIKDHRALVLRKTLKELRELIDKSRDLYPKAFPGAKYKESEKVWTFPSGAKLEFGYLEKDSDVYQYQGQAFSWIGFDEVTHLASEFAWNYLASRLRTTNPDIIPYMRCTANPGGVGHAWVKKRYIEPSEPNTSFIGEDGISRRFIPASLYDNPYLTQDGNYEKMLKSLPEVHRRRLLLGDWDVNEGAAFPEFDRLVHVIEPFTIPQGWNKIKAIDYGYTSPSCCLWAAIDPEDGTVIIYRELYQRGLTGEELKYQITNMEREEIRQIIGVLDGAAWNRTGYSGPTIGEQMVRPPYGHRLRPADKNRIAGKVQIHQYLKKNEIGKPQLLIFETCHNLIRELTTIPLSDKNSEDVDTHADDHAYDALRYLLMSRPRKETMYEEAFKFKQAASLEFSDDVFGY